MNVITKSYLEPRDVKYLTSKEKLQLLDEMGIDVDRIKVDVCNKTNYTMSVIALRQYIEEME